MSKRPISAFRVSLVTVCLLAATALAGTSVLPARAWIGSTPIGRALKRIVSPPKAERGAAAAFAPPSITATMTDALLLDNDSDGKADPNDKIRYTATIANAAGVDAATAVAFAAPVDAKTSLIPGSVTISPLAVNESYNSVGNMTLTSSSIGADCNANSLRSVLCNDTLFSGTLTHFGATSGTTTTVVNGTNTVTTSNGGTVLLNADGTFVYNPAAGYEGADAFSYLLTSANAGAAGTDVGTVTIAVGGANGMVWFVTANANGTGRQSAPISLNSLRAINNGTGTNPAANDTIFLFEGTHGLTATLTLLSNQKLLGQDVNGVTLTALGAPTAQSGNAYPTLDAAGGTVSITAAGLDALTLGADNEIAGFTVATAARAIVGSAVGALNVRDVVVNTNGGGLAITTSGAMTTTSPFTGFTSITTVGGTNGISLTGVTGSLNLGGGALSGATGPTFIVAGSSAAITYGGTITQATANQPAIQFQGGNTSTVNFNGAVSATNGTGLQFDNADGSYTFAAAVTLNGGDAGIDIINGSAGTFSFPSNTAITNPSGIAFRQDSSTANVTYAGTISKTNATTSAISINAKTSGTNTFSGAITGGTTTANAITLTNNTGGTINFTGGLALTTTSGIGFNATGGGTVSATQNNSSIVNTITSTTGTALNVSSTTIGASGLTFRSIDVDGNDSLPANGIVLGTTGSSGGLTVTGTGSAGTGGTIRDTSGHGISLSSTEALSLSYMNITSNLGSGIGGSSVVGLVLNGLSITSNGDSAATDDCGINLTAVTGTSTGGARPTTISNTTISENLEFQLQITNSSGTLTNFLLSNNTISSTGASGVIGNLVNFLGGGTSTMTLTVSGGTFTGAAPATATAIGAVNQGSSHTVNVSGATFTNNNVGVDCSTDPVSNLVFNCNVSNNNFQGTRAHAINTFHNANSPFNRTFNGTFNNNTIGTAGTNLSGSQLGAGITISNEGAIATARYTISGNQIHETAFQAVSVNVGLSGLATGGGTTELTILNNTFSNTDSRALIIQDNQSPGPFPTICANVSGNTFGANIVGQAGDGTWMRIREGSGIVNVTQATPTAAANSAELDDANGGNNFTKFTISGTPQFSQAACNQSSASLSPRESTPYHARRLALPAFLHPAAVLRAAPQTIAHESSAWLAMLASSTHDATRTACTVAASQPARIARGAQAVAREWTALLTDRAEGVLAVAGRIARSGLTALSPPLEARSGENASATIGTLTAGKTVRVVFDVTVDDLPPVAQYSTQGTVSGTNFSNVLTDDPAAGGATDPTTTPGDRYLTATTVISSLNPSEQGQSITFTATVTPSEGSTTPDGTVQFKDGASNIGSAVTCSSAPSNTCTAAVTTTTLATGSRNITAVYSGGTNHDPSTSDVLVQVNNACTTNPVVINSNDTGAGSLRQAIADACTGNTITFDMGTVTSPINLTSAQLTLAKNVTITGPGANLLTVGRGAGAGNFRIFAMGAGRTVTISGLSITNGVAVGALGADSTGGGGGGIYNGNATLTLSGVSVTGNSAVSGGGVLNAGTSSLTILNSTIAGNLATNGHGGGVFSQGGAAASLEMANTTVSGNSSSQNGGGLYLQSTTGATRLTNTTVTANRADSGTLEIGAGGGMFIALNVPVTLRNTIVAANFVGGAPSTSPADITGEVTTAPSVNNLIGNASNFGGLTHGVNGNQVGASNATIDPRLGALANNGGPVQTHALLAGSPALDAGSNNAASEVGLTLDQRGTGFPRVRDAADANTTQTVDIGAFEADPAVEDIANKTTLEDAAVPAFTFNLGDSASAFTSITATSDNTTLLPNANAVIGNDTPSTRTLTLTPAAHRYGTATVTVTATKTINSAPVSMSDTFLLTVTPVADAPAVTNAATRANLQTTSGLVITPNTADGAEVTHFYISNIVGGTLFQANGSTAISDGSYINLAEGAAGLKFTPTTGSTTTGTIDVQAAIGQSQTNISGVTRPSITVDKHDTQTTITADTPDPSDPGIAVPIAYTVASTTGGPAPTGDVVVTVSGGSETCTGTVASGSCNLTFTTSGVGRTVTATYGGDTVNNGSSDTESHTVNTCESSPVVTTNADGGPGSLRQALSNVCAGGTITFDMGTVTDPIDLTSAELAVTKNVTISGPGNQVLGIERNATAPAFRIFNISASTVTISGLRIAKGSAADGAGIRYSGAGTLTLADTIVSQNDATGAGSGTGGGISNAGTGTINLTGSLVALNTSAGLGGGLYNAGTGIVTMTGTVLFGNSAQNGGGVYMLNGTLTATNTTIGNNTSSNGGAGINKAAGTLNLTNVTISANAAGGIGGGIANQAGTANVGNSIIYGNTAVFDGGPDFYGTLASQGWNILGSTEHTTITGTTTGNQLGVNPRLGALALNGGATYTFALLAGSPALDAGDNTLASTAGLTTDQRGTGFPRVRDAADAGTTQTVDIGAFEADPSLPDITDKSTAEDTPLAFTFEVGDVASSFSGATVTSSNTTLLPNANIAMDEASASTLSLTLTPAANLSGTTTVTVTLTKTINGAPVSVSDTFVLTVTAIDDPPTLNAIADPSAILEDAGLQTVNLAGISAGGGESQALTVTATSNNTGLIPNPTVTYTSPNATGSLAYTPVANKSGSAVITVTVTDAGDKTVQRTFTVAVTAVNDQPTLTAIADPAAINEDAGQQTVNLAGITDGSAGENQTLTVTATSNNTGLIPNPTVTYTSPNATGSLTYTPVANANGTAVITVTVNDGGGGTETVVRTFTVTVNAVDDNPTLDAISDPAAILEDAGQQTVNLTGITAGPGGESQVLTVSATSNNTGLIPNPTVTYTSPNATGSLAYTPVANQSGTAVITVTVTDAGTLTVQRTFTVTVTSVNDQPTLDPIANPAAIDEDAGQQTVNLAGITDGGAGENQTMTILASSDNTALIPNPTVTYTSPNTTGSLSYTPVANASGTAVITVTAKDSGGGTELRIRTFTVTVNAVDDVPTLNAISNPAAIDEDAGQQTVNLAGITAGGGESQTLTVTATSNNTGLIPNPAVTYTSPNATGSLAYTPVANANGSAVITVTVTDTGAAGLNTTTRTFTVTVNAVDDNPTLDAISNPAAILEDAGQQTVNLSGITAGGGESQALTVTATSNNTALIPNPTVTYTSPNATGSLSYTPVANQHGSAVITVTVTDAGTLTVQRTFTVTVTSVNDQPTLTAIADPAAILEDAGQQTVNLAGITDGGAGENQTLTVTATSNNTALIPNPTVTYSSPDATGSLSYTPVANQNGSAIITVTVNDGGGGTQTIQRTFTVTVTAVDDAPTLDVIADPAAINEDAAQQTVNLTGISAGPNESQPPLTVTATSNNTALIPNPTVTYTSPNATGSLAYTPVANKSGTAVITVTVTDAGATNNTFSRTFTVTVTAVNDQPTLDAIANPAAINEDAAAQTVNLAGITDGGAGENQTLTVTATSNNTALIPNPTVTYTSPNATGSLTYTPVANANGSAVITVTVNDGGGGTETVVRTFTVTVNSVDDVPTLNAISNPAAIDEDAGQQTVNLSGITAGGGETDTLTVTATSNNTGLIPNPTVTYTSPDATGSLAYTPVANQSGTAVITVTVTDTGGAGLNTTTRTFTVAVTALNDQPTLDAIANPAAILEDAATQTVNLAGIAAGGGETQTLTVTATSNNTALIPNPTVTYTSPGATGSLSYTPVANASGTAVITVTVTDNGGTTGGGVNTFSRTFTVTVTAVNDAPTLTAVANPAAILEDAAQQTVNLAGISAGPGETQTLTVTATSNNTALIPNPTVTYTSANATGSLAYTPVADQSGTAVITVTVTDNGGTANGGVNTVTRTFTVTVTAVNDAPTLNTIANPPASQEDDLSTKTVNFSGVGAGGGETQTMTVTATSNNTALIPNPTVAYTSPNATGSLTYAALPNAYGTAVVTVTVTDSGGTANGGVNTFSRTFTVTVNGINDAPTITAIANQTIAKWSTTGPLAFTIGDLETAPASLTVTAVSNNTTLVPASAISFGGSGTARTITVTPNPAESGTAQITVTVSDGELTASTTFTLTVEAGASERVIIGLGPFPSDGGWLPTRGEGVSAIAPRNWGRLPWDAYNAINGEVHPAVGNLDGDALDEVVLGFGAGGGGWIAVLDDAAHNYAVLKWIQVQWPDYVATTGGSVWPAVGDLDGDGRAEIVAGLGTGSGGYVEIFDDALTGFAHVGWRQLAWNDYNALNGETHPAVGDVDGDGRAEIILGTAAGGRGYLEVLDGTAPFANRRWLQVGWAGYNTSANGPTFPAAGDLDGDGRAEIVIGLGPGGGGWLEVRDDAAAGYASVRWLRVDWGAYNASNGETHPAIGNIDGDALPEIAVGLGTAPEQGGWIMVFDDATTAYSHLPWVQVAWTAYVASGGATYPSIGRLR